MKKKPGQTEGWTEGQKDEQKERRKDEGTEGQTEGRLEGQKEGWTDRLYFIGPFWIPPGLQKRKIKKEIMALNFQLMPSLNILASVVLLNRINVAVIKRATTI